MESKICPNCGTEMLGERSEILKEISTFKCPNCGIKFHLFEEVLKDYKKEVGKVVREKVEGYLRKIDGVSELKNGEAEKFHQKLCMDYLNRGGKYLRPTLLILTAEALGGRKDLALLTAAAMEISENWLLIHDDFQDQSVMRRGALTLHLRYNPGLAVNAGDALHLIMWKILQENAKIIGERKSLKIMEEFYRMLARTALGQTAELLFAHLNKFDLTEDDVYYILDGKTSYYTIAGPMRLGAIIAEDREDYLESKIFPKLNELGIYLGRAFQIIDDVLDLTSDFRGLKQQVGNDIYEGKRTLILAHLLSQASAFDRKRITEILKKPREEKTEAEAKYIIHLMKEYGSIDYARKVAKDFALKALELFKTLDFFKNEDAKRKLLLGIDFIVNREF